MCPRLALFFSATSRLAVFICKFITFGNTRRDIFLGCKFMRMFTPTLVRAQLCGPRDSEGRRGGQAYRGRGDEAFPECTEGPATLRVVTAGRRDGGGAGTVGHHARLGNCPPHHRSPQASAQDGCPRKVGVWKLSEGLGSRRGFPSLRPAQGTDSEGRWEWWLPIADGQECRCYRCERWVASFPQHV